MFAAGTIQAIALGCFATIAAPQEVAFPAHRVVGNVYYVGTKSIAVYLVATDKGHIVINSGYQETVPFIRLGVESLGFKMRDVKIILASHAHSDHVAGHALLKELTGAKVFVMRGDDDVVRSGGKGQYLYTSSRWKPCPVDRVLKDGEKVQLGGVRLTAHRTPGHTPGCTTWGWKVKDKGRELTVVVVGSPNVNPGYQLVGNKDYPEISEDFATTFRVLKKLKCDVFLGAHGDYYGMHEKFARRKKAKENTFIDPQGYKAYITEREQYYRTTLAKQKARKQSSDAGKN